jgi:site-specific DNA recombinase
LYEKEEVRKKMVKKGLNCKKNNFCKVLHNLVYCGKIFVPAWKDEPEEIVIGLHEPIVSDELFNKVQQVAAAKRYIKPKPSRRKETLPMRGYLVCNKCGKNLTGSKSKGKGGIYHYYHCQNGCKERFRADAAHGNFSEWLNEITLKPDIAALYIADIEDTIKTEFGNTYKEIEQLEKAKQKSEDMRAKVERKYVEEIIDESTFKRVKKSYEDEIYNYSARIAELKNEDTDFKNYAEYCFTLLSKLDIAYERTDLEGKQKLLSSIFPNKLVFNGKSYRTPVQNEIHKILFSNNKAFEGGKMKKVGDNTDQCAMGWKRGLEPPTLRTTI